MLNIHIIIGADCCRLVQIAADWHRGMIMVASERIYSEWICCEWICVYRQERFAIGMNLDLLEWLNGYWNA